MSSNSYEIRDPIHTFVKLDQHERQVLDSRPFQRLRHINQLGMSHLVYPSANHKRFEHSLGTMELASRVFDVVTRPAAITDEVKGLIPEIEDKEILAYWRRVLRIAALCHDVGHLPFSHTSEDLLPNEWSHEHLSAVIIRCDEMREIWDKSPPLKTENIVKLAVGPEKMPHAEFTNWEALLAEIIVGDAFGVDRIDYLLRDSHHTGVAYGKFDHYRLIDTLRILPNQPSEQPQDASSNSEVALGIEDGGLHSVESLLLARYFMFMQVYCHRVRRIYDIHLRDFLKDWLPDGTFRTNVEQHLNITDIEVSGAMRKAYGNKAVAGHKHAKRILDREHFKVLYTRTDDDLDLDPVLYTRTDDDLDLDHDIVDSIYQGACKKFGEDTVRKDLYTQRGGEYDFPVLKRNGDIVFASNKSQILRNLPTVDVGYVFVSREKENDALAWLKREKNNLFSNPETEQ